MKLNLEAKTKEQELVKTYMEENVQEMLAEKINNGVFIEKDGKKLRNVKNLDGFMKYASDEARKLALKGSNSACIEDRVVYGWAIHYFEEDSLEGELFDENGEVYTVKPKPVTVKKTEPTKAQPQISLFDFMKNDKKETEYEELTEEDIDEALHELTENTKEKPTETTIYDEIYGEIPEDENRKFSGNFEDSKTEENILYDKETLEKIKAIFGDNLIMR